MILEALSWFSEVCLAELQVRAGVSSLGSLEIPSCLFAPEEFALADLPFPTLVSSIFFSTLSDKPKAAALTG